MDRRKDSQKSDCCSRKDCQYRGGINFVINIINKSNLTLYITVRQLVFATNNSHKLEEIRRILGESFAVMSLKEIGCHDDIPENENTLQGNAIAKARWVKERYGYDCFADDTGLEVDALDGAPGVHSARYAPGEGHDSEANMRLLLRNMEGKTDRTARFRTVIALIEGDTLTTFEGVCEGTIAVSPAGEGGFGYDPVFVPEGDSRTFAQLSADEKNAISHRGRATVKLINHLHDV
ncbi:MAG: non-canonical purine NTP diphosphatase [Bacteroidales bacterium]|nr:non-canonical purine NTP diphosphatase [Bacteroidales bacterium]